MLDCALCKQKGASVGCVLKRCGYTVHVYCAVELEGWRPSALQREFTCPVHRQQESAKLALEDAEFNEDISHGQESLPVTMWRPLVAVESEESEAVLLCGRCGPSGGGEAKRRRIGPARSPRVFSYITRNVDSDGTLSVVTNTNKLPCCNCEGLCDNPAVCACLQVDSLTFAMHSTRLTIS
jgi:hypothetical protein